MQQEVIFFRLLDFQTFRLTDYQMIVSWTAQLQGFYLSV